MNNLYLIVSADTKLIEIEIARIIKKEGYESADIVKYDLEENNIEDVIIDADTYSLFTPRKVIIGHNASFLTQDKNNINHNLLLLEKYINKPNPNSLIILAVDKLDERKKIVKLAKEKFQLVSPSLNLMNYTKALFDDYKIDNQVLSYFLSLTGNSLERITNEVLKLKAYKLAEKIILKTDIDLLVIKNIDDTIFSLTDAIIKKDKQKSIDIYNNLLNNNIEIIQVIITISNQIRLIYQVKILKGLTNKEIAALLELHEYPVKLARASSYLYSESELTSILSRLAKMDEEIKTGKSNKEFAFPLFIVSL